MKARTRSIKKKKAHVIQIHKRLVYVRNTIEYFSEKNSDAILENQNEMRFLDKYVVLELVRL